MYFSDFISNPTRAKSYFLSGKDDFLKEYLVGYISKMHNKSVIRLDKKQPPKYMGSSFLFREEPLWVVDPATTFIPEGLAIKLGNKITKPYTSAGYVEIVCSLTFDNQIEDFVKQLALVAGLNTSSEFIKYICYLNQYDPCSCCNTVNLISLHKNISFEEIPLISGSIVNPDITTTVNHFVDGKYSYVLTDIIQAKVDSRLLCFILADTIARAMDTVGVVKPTWMQRRLLQLWSKLEPLNVGIILSTLNSIHRDILSPTAVIRSRLVYLVAYIGGWSNINIGDVNRNNGYYEE